MSESATVKSGSIASGLQWTSAAQIARVALQLGVAIVLARLLQPSDFGLLAMATAFTSIAEMFQSLGMHGSIVQRERITERLIDTIYITNILLSALLTGCIIVVAPWVASFYGDPAVEPVIQVLAFTIFMYAIGGVPGAILRRRMHFSAIAKVSVATGTAQALVALILALNGYGVWSLVLGVLAAATVHGLLLLWAARYCPRPRFSLTDLKSIAAFSANITAANVLNLISSHMDKLVIGRWLGADALGFYGMSLRFTRQPIQMFVRPILGPVMFPAYSRMQNDDAVTIATMRRAMTAVTLVIAPALLGFALIAQPFVVGVLGAKWAPAITLIHVLAPVGVLQGLRVTVASLLVARDRTGVFLVARLIFAAALLSAYALGLQWALIGVVTGILVAEAIATFVELRLCARQVGARLTDLLADSGRVLVATAVMAAAVSSLRWWLAGTAVTELVEVGAAVAGGALTYALAVFVLRIPALLDLARLLPNPVHRLIRRLWAAT